MTDSIQTVFAIHCQVEDSDLKVEGFYAEPLLQSSRVRLAHEERTLTIELPPALLNRPRPMYAKEVIFPICSE